MEKVFLFDPANDRFLTSEYLQHPLLSKPVDTLRAEQRAFYRGRYLGAALLLGVMVIVTCFMLISASNLLRPLYWSIGTPALFSLISVPVIMMLWFVISLVLVRSVLGNFTRVYDPTGDAAVEQEGTVILGEVQAIDWIKHRWEYWLTVRAHYPEMPDTTLHAAIPTAYNADNPPQTQVGTMVALIYTGVWGTPFYKAEVL